MASRTWFICRTCLTIGWAPARAASFFRSPIPYVVHHGALGSFATVYLEDGVDAGAIIKRIAALPLIQTVVSGAEGCAMFDLPEDRLGDIIVVSRDTKVIGTSHSRHDLAALKEPLRSHGGITEQTIPIIVNRQGDVAASAASQL